MSINIINHLWDKESEVNKYLLYYCTYIIQEQVQLICSDKVAQWLPIA